MKQSIFVPAKYIYIAIGSLSTLVSLGIFLFLISKSQALESEDPQVLSASSGAPILEEKIIEEKKKQSGVTSIEPVTISHTVKEGDSIASIAKAYQADPQTIVDYPYNKIGDNFELEVGQVIIVPAGIIGKYTLETIAQGNGFLGWPIKGQITQLAFWWHPGSIDIDLNTGDPIKAAKDGVVKEVIKQATGYGFHVIVDHGNGVEAIYAHLSRIDVEKGQYVSKGQILGLGGSTGRSTGPHLHFEVHQNGKPVDPMTLLN